MVDEEPRVVLIGHLDTPAGSLAVANTHLSFVPGWGQWQLVRVLRDLAPVNGPVVLMGDLNMHNPLPALITGYRSLARHLTFPAEVPNRQLDHILLRGRLGTVLSSSAPLLPLSDHRALSGGPVPVPRGGPTVIHTDNYIRYSAGRLGQRHRDRRAGRAAPRAAADRRGPR